MKAGMFEGSDLLQRDVLVLRATAPPDAQFSVLDETGREIGRVVVEGELVQKNVPSRLVLYDRQHTRILAIERSKDCDGPIPECSVVDGRDDPVETGRRVFTLKFERGRRLRRRLPGVGVFLTIRDSTKAEVGSYAQALPPEGDHRLGVTFLFTLTAEVSCELRLAALGFAINFTESSSRFRAWMLKDLPKMGLAWPGSANEHPLSTAENG